MPGVEHEEDNKTHCHLASVQHNDPHCPLQKQLGTYAAACATGTFQDIGCVVNDHSSEKLLTKRRTVGDRVSFGAVLLRQETVCR